MTRMFLLVRFSLVLSFLSFASAIGAAELLPLDHFTRSDDVGTMKLSPDGEFLAITSGQHGGEFLTFVQLKDGKLVAGVRAPEGLLIHEFHWASNTRVIFMIAERYAGRVTPSLTGEIFAVDRDGGRQLRIYGYRAGEMSTGTHQRVRDANYASAEVVSLLDEDDRNILIAEMPWRQVGNMLYYNRDAKPEITRLDIYNGKETRITRVPLSSASVIVDREDHPRFAVGLSEGRRLSVAWKRTKDSESWEAFELPGFREGTVKPLHFTPDNRKVLFTGVPDGQRYAALFELVLADHQVQKIAELADTDVLDVITDFQDQDAIGVVGYTDKRVQSWLLPDHPATRLQQALQRAFVGNEVSFISHSADGKRAIVFVRSDVAPGEYLLLDTQSKKAEMIRAARQWIDLHKMRPKEPITFNARDGLPLHGYLTRPAGDGPYPLIVLPHGGPHGIRDIWSFDWEAQLFASRGYAVLQVNFRGSGGYGMDFEAAGYRQWGARMQDDITDATRWAIEQKVTSADRVCIYGASYGGYAALMGAVREPKLYRCAIGYAGVYDLELMFSSGDIPRSKLGLSYLGEVLGTDAADLRARSPTTHAAAIEAPVLLIHGKEDWRADYKQATRMKTELEKAKKPVEWLLLRGEGHGVFDDNTRLQVYEGILKFLDTHLGSRTSATQ
ncbi:MAG TPA: S9 family peptidase [Steroidobacteraceae bacterium]|nr:S9 family peptidase [Steroidobacteraceae bacterium]